MCDTIDTLASLFTDSDLDDLSDLDSDTQDLGNGDGSGISLDFERLVEDVTRPWGEFHNLARKENEWFVKFLKIKKGQRLSLQKHFKREEMWIITKGKVKAQVGDDFIELGSKETVFIGVEQQHRLEGITDAEFVEISFGDFAEDDEIRLEDDYGRID